MGEDGPDCGRCSNCLDEREQVDITVETQKVLSCVKRMGEQFWQALVGKVLTGSADQKVTQWGFEKIANLWFVERLVTKRSQSTH